MRSYWMALCCLVRDDKQEEVVQLTKLARAHPQTALHLPVYCHWFMKVAKQTAFWVEIGISVLWSKLLSEELSGEIEQHQLCAATGTAFEHLICNLVGTFSTWPSPSWCLVTCSSSELSAVLLLQLSPGLLLHHNSWEKRSDQIRSRRAAEACKRNLISDPNSWVFRRLAYYFCYLVVLESLM